MENERQSHTSPFDAIKQINNEIGEHWSARELCTVLGYTAWRNFSSTVIKRAMKACQENGQAVSDHFVRSYKMVTLGSGSQRKTEDILLSRYAAYLTVMNGDPKMPVVAVGQQYFAEQTRRQELADEDVLADLSENQKRLVVRSQLTLHNTQLAETANLAGVITPRDFAIFQDHGYKGLYGGMSAKDIHGHKELKKSQKILDHMNSGELAANLFRSTQAEERIRNKAIGSKDGANQEHRKTGEEIRELIARGGGTLPENQPTPAKSVQQLQREKLKRLEYGQQPSLFKDLSNLEE